MINTIPHTTITESDIRDSCIYCGGSLANNRWHSQHVGSIHYKTTRCMCGRIHTIKIDGLMSSGHDDWDGKGWMTLKEYSSSRKQQPQTGNLEKRF